MESAQRNRCISEVCNTIIGDSWLHPQKQRSQEVRAGFKDARNPTAFDEYGRGIPSSLMFNAIRSIVGTQSSDDGFLFRNPTTLDEFGRRVLSSPLFDAFPSKAGIQSSDDGSRLRKISQRLLALVQRSSTYTAELAEELSKRTTSDEWLHDYIQSDDFDGTWVAIICGFYQSLYLYHTQIFENHHLSRSLDNHSLASNGKIVILLLRLQHLRTFQHVVAINLRERPFPQDFELLGSQEFLSSCLLDSLQQTMNDLQSWSMHVHSYNCKACTIPSFSYHTELEFLADILPRLLDTEDDIWLWKQLHCLDETSPIKTLMFTIIVSLYQGLILYGKNNNEEEMAQGRLTALLFRSHHLKIFKDLLCSRPGLLTFDVRLIMEDRFLESSTLTIHIMNSFMREEQEKVEHGLQSWLREIHSDNEGPSLSSIEGASYYVSEGASYSHGSINVFLGTKLHQVVHGLSTSNEEPIDLKQVHALGGLICTIEGESTTSSSGDGLNCTSWCIVRHTPTNLFFCVDLKNDAYGNKLRILDGESTIDYEGVIEVEIADGNTFVRSLESDGSSYNGCLENFVDWRGEKQSHPSCAEVALHNLPQSDCLKQANLKCSALHMLALAFLAGDKDSLTLKWGGGAGHIEYFTSLNGHDKGPSGQPQIALRKCTLLFTNEGKLAGEDTIWEGNGGQVSTDPQDCNPKGMCVHGESTKENEVSDKVKIILEQSKSWLRCGFMQDYPAMDKEKIRASLIKAREEVEKGLLSVETASALAQTKQNTGGAIGALTFKLQLSHEHRPAAASKYLDKFCDERNMVEHLPLAVVVPRDLHNDDFNNLKALLMSGRMKEHPREFFILKSKGSCSLHVFLCSKEDFIWLTDIVMSDASVAEEIFNDKLNGKSLTISRKDSDLYIDLDVTSNILSRFVQTVQKKRQLISNETMIHEERLPNFAHSGNAWKYIIGDRKDYNEKNYFWKATEYAAIVCSATIYTTGGAIVRMQKKICDTSQRSTSLYSQQQRHATCQQPSSSNSQQLIKPLIHGSCEKVCSSFFETMEDKVTVVGKFSTYNRPSFWPHVYWG